MSLLLTSELGDWSHETNCNIIRVQHPVTKNLYSTVTSTVVQFVYLREANCILLIWSLDLHCTNKIKVQGHISYLNLAQIHSNQGETLKQFKGCFFYSPLYTAPIVIIALIIHVLKILMLLNHRDLQLCCDLHPTFS